MAEKTIQRGRVGRMQSWLAQRARVPLGRWGEWVALRYLLWLGFDILARNWTTRHGELDLVAREGDILVFVEVKTRRTPSLFPPEYSVTTAKEQQLEQLALRFTQRFELTDEAVRVDLIAIDTPDRREFELRHYRGLLG